jgi:hypothetical protein
MNLTLKNIKTFNGNEGPGFSATLYIDGRKAGDVVDDANGGEYRYHVSREDHAALLSYAGSLPDETDEERSARGLSALPEHSPETPPLSPAIRASCNLDSLVAKIVDEIEMEKSMKKRCASAVCYRLVGDAAGTFLRVAPRGGKKAIPNWDAWVEKTVAEVHKRHGDKIEVVYNEKYAKATQR